jgi:hypothetical protein
MNVNWPQAIVGATLGLLLGSLFIDRLKRLWSGVAQMVWKGKVRRIEGRWDSEYSYLAEDGTVVRHEDAIRLEQHGVYVSGKNEGRTNHEYEMKGRFHDQAILTGAWRSVRPEVTYHGAFQLVVSADGTKMSGKWLGNSNSGGIRNGDWTWEKRD